MKMEQDRQPEANGYLDCERCCEIMPKKLRARWNCGLLAPKKRTGPGFPAPAHWGNLSDVCPGYLITLPVVIETARAKVHWEKGSLKEKYEDEPLTAVLFDCIEILVGASGAAETHMLNESRDK